MLSTRLSNEKDTPIARRLQSRFFYANRFKISVLLSVATGLLIESKLRLISFSLEIHQINRQRACFDLHVMKLGNFFFNFKPNGLSFKKVFSIAVEFQSRLCTLARKRRRQKRRRRKIFIHDYAV